VKTILIIILLNSNACPMQAEFNDANACENAAAAVRQAHNAKTICAPKGADWLR